jgi:uncharacterized coiled-coil DUF342 family protein
MENEDLNQRIERLEREAAQHLNDMTKMKSGLDQIYQSIQIFHALTLDLAGVVDKILEVYAASGGDEANDLVAIPSALLKQLQRAKDDWSRVLENGASE